MTPLDVIATAINARYNLPPVDGIVFDEFPPDQQTILEALTDDRILSHAMAAVRQHTWTAPDVEDLPDRDLREVLRIAFGSLKEGGQR